MRIVQDVFPCHLSVAPADYSEDFTSIRSKGNPDGVFYRDITRVVLVEDETGLTIWVAQDAPSGPQIIFQERLAEYIKADKPEQDAHAKTVSGKILAFSKDNNCGCGSRLKSWNPYRTLHSVKDSF
jgi:hypothetical protein